MQPKKNVKTTYRDSSFQQIEKMHPYKMLLYLGIIGFSMIFLFLMIAYSLSTASSTLIPTLHLPKMFTLGTFLLISSSFSMAAAVKAYGDDNMRRLNYMLFITLMIGVVFAGCQMLGWLELRDLGVFLEGETSRSFLYLMSALHVLHLFGGLLFLSAAVFLSFRAKRDPIRALVIVTNPFEKLKLELLATYWHFLGALWVSLFFFFLFMY